MWVPTGNLHLSLSPSCPLLVVADARGKAAVLQKRRFEALWVGWAGVPASRVLL